MNTVESEEGAFSQPEETSQTVEPLATTMAHRGYTLVGAAFVVFEMFFLTMYSDKYWFGVDIGWLGIPAVLCAMVIAHFLLMALESDKACRAFRIIWKGLPPSVYRKWVVIHPHATEPSIGYGVRRILCRSIDGLELTLLGNLCIRSRSLCGLDTVDSDLVFKIPFGFASIADQEKLISFIRRHNPTASVNKRLSKRDKTDVKGTAAIQLLGAAFLFVVLLDVGHSTFHFLQILQGYYNCQTAIADPAAHAKLDAANEYERAESIRQHPLPISWVSNKLLASGAVASGVFQARSDAQWALKKRDDAVASLRKALELSPKSFRINLRIARRLTEMGRLKEAEDEAKQAIENHKDTFLPQLYMVVLSLKGEGKAAADKVFDEYKKKADQEIFGEDPPWPPGGNRFLHDIWYKDDVEFIFNRLMSRQ